MAPERSEGSNYIQNTFNVNLQRPCEGGMA